MTEPRPSDRGPLPRRHRRIRIGPATRGSRRTGQILLAATAGVVTVATAFGYATQQPPDTTAAAPPPPAAEIPQTPADAESPVGADGPSPSGGIGAGPVTSPAAPAGTAAGTRPAPTAAPPAGAALPGPTPPPAATGPPPATTVPPPAATTRPPDPPPPAAKPRLVGPSSLDGFDDFLDAFCDRAGFRGASLFNGRRTPTTGRWVCTRFARFRTIDLDDACQDTFGAAARARPRVDGDIRTVRCFDS